MVEIIPNWHPVFLHFTIALISVSAICYLVGYCTINNSIGKELLIVGRWCLWLGAIATVATVIAGFIAYYSVAHNASSHEAMTVHRNWALIASSIIMVATAWSLWLHFNNKKASIGLILTLLVAFSVVSITAWHGAKLVYQYGVGVMTISTTNSKGKEQNHKTGSADSSDHHSGTSKGSHDH